MSDTPHPGEPWLALDTSLAAARVQHAVYRRMSEEKRWRMAFEMTESAKRSAVAGVRAMHPEYTPRQAELAVIRVMLGDDLFRLAYGTGAA